MSGTHLTHGDTVMRQILEEALVSEEGGHRLADVRKMGYAELWIAAITAFPSQIVGLGDNPSPDPTVIPVKGTSSVLVVAEKETPLLRLRQQMADTIEISAQLRLLDQAYALGQKNRCAHLFEADPGMTDSQHRYCTLCGVAE